MSIARSGEPLKYFYESMNIETDDCILWKYAKNRRGYGQVYVNGKLCLVHRMSLEYKYGKTSDNKKYAIHEPIICHNTQCFNYRHLRWGTPSENSRDKIIDGTSRCGEKNPISKLTNDNAIEILNSDEDKHTLAKKFGVSYHTIYEIQTGRRWTRITNIDTSNK